MRRAGETRRSGLRGAAVTACVILLAACASEQRAPGPDVPYEQPAWMAEEALVQERYVTVWADCMREQGHGADLNPDGSVSGQFSPDQDDEARRAALDARMVAVAVCEERMAGLRPDEPPSWDLVYDRALDTHACLRHEGYESLPEPPSRAAFVDAWAAQGAAGTESTAPWMPFATLHDEHPDVTAEEWYRLKAACTEYWLSYTTNVE